MEVQFFQDISNIFYDDFLFLLIFLILDLVRFNHILLFEYNGEHEN
jgi:hypothetical protein